MIHMFPQSLRQYNSNHDDIDVSSLKLHNSWITKVTKDRIFSLNIAPLSEKLLVLAGDKWGKIGVWDTVS